MWVRAYIVVSAERNGPDCLVWVASEGPAVQEWSELSDT